MRQLRLLVAALFLTVAWHAQALSISLDSSTLKDANGNPMPTTGLVVLVASTSDGTFNAPTPLNFASGDDIVIAKWDLSGFGTPGVLSAFTNTTTVVTASNPLMLYWYPTLDINATAPGQNTPYGQYTDPVGVDGSAPWFGDSPSATITLRFWTADANTMFDSPSTNNPASAGNATNVTPIAIAILSQPASTVQSLGGTAIFSVNASGSSLAYNWRKDGVNLADGGNVSGSTTANLTLSNISAPDGASYSVVITNTQAAVTSSDAILIVDDLTITTQPNSFTVACGDVWPCLSVTASASTSLTYQWYTPDSNGTPIPNATNATLCLNNTFASAGNYSVVVTDGYGKTAASSVATVTVVDTTGPVITLNGANPQSVCKGSPYNEANATALDSCDGSVAVTASGTVDTGTVGTYTITYVANDSHGNTNTATRVVNVNDCTVLSDPAITNQPVAQVAVPGQKNVQFSLAATGTGTLQYQWFKEGVGALAHKTNSTLLIPTVALTSKGTYYCIVTGSHGTAESSHVGLSVYYAPTPTIAPPKLTKTAGNVAVFKVNAGSKNVYDSSLNLGGPVSFQWTKNNSPISSGGNISIVNSISNSVLTIIDVQAADQATYQCTVSNNAGPVTTPNTKGLLIVVADTKNPVSHILHPSPNLRFTNGVAVVGQTNIAPELDIDGKVADNGMVTNVALIRIVPPGSYSNNVTLYYRTNKSGLMLPGSVLWTNHVTLVPGTNTFTAIANDTAGTPNINNSARTYYYFTNVTVTINPNPLNGGTIAGTTSLGVKPVQGDNQLPIGIGFKLTATKKTGFTFSSWTDGGANILGTSPVLYFVTPPSNVVINANFTHP